MCDYFVSDHFYIYDDFMFTPISWNIATFSMVIYVLYSWYGLRDIIPLFLWDLIFAYGWIIVVCSTNIIQLFEHDSSTYIPSPLFHPVGTPCVFSHVSWNLPSYTAVSDWFGRFYVSPTIVATKIGGLISGA